MAFLKRLKYGQLNSISMDGINFESVLKELQKGLKPYDSSESNFVKIPEKGIAEDSILGTVSKYSERENSPWKAGKVSGAVYYGDEPLLSSIPPIIASNHSWGSCSALPPSPKNPQKFS